MAGYTQREINEIENASASVSDLKNKMAGHLKEISEMGLLGQFCDSMVPEEQRAFYRWFSLKFSDPVVLGEEVEGHRKLFVQLETAFQKAKNGDDDAEDCLDEAYDKMMAVYKNIELKVKKEDSKELYKIQKDLLAEKDKVENRLLRVDRANNRRQMRNMRKELKETMQSVSRMGRQLEESNAINREMTWKFEDLSETNSQLLEKQSELSEVNRKMNAHLEQLAEEGMKEREERRRDREERELEREQRRRDREERELEREQRRNEKETIESNLKKLMAETMDLSAKLERQNPPGKDIDENDNDFSLVKSVGNLKGNF